MSETYSGRCMCGAIQFEAKGEPKWVRWCYCESCRRHTGAPASVFAAFDDSAVVINQGSIATYISSPGVERGFCARCGSTLTCSNSRLPNEKHYHVGTFDRASDLAPDGAFFASERLPWLPHDT